MSLLVSTPISYSFSSVPSRGPRDVVLEDMNLGHGYRLGVGVGLLIRLNSWLGLLVEAEWATQHLSHVRTYRRADGTGGEAQLPLSYELRWLTASVGFAVEP